jgi:4-aminobutyrate aminotransferase-like enzyme
MDGDGDAAKIGSRAWIDRHRAALVPAAHQYYDPPLVLVSGKDRMVTDADGRSYLDFYGGILTVSIGHQNPKVIEAVEQQVRLLTHTSTLYVSPPMVELAERLAQITPEPLQQTFFTTSGTEANETAIAMAQDATGQSEVIALRHSYSGRSQLAMNLTGQAPWRNTSTALPVRHAHNAYCYRCPFGKTPDKCGLECAQDLDEMIQTSTNGHPAAFIAEPVQGVGGFITPPPAYFQEAVGIARKYGALFISDEVQTGFGRTGRWFGIDHYGVTPDIMTFAKGLANGLPIGATITTRDIASRYRAPTISTFGGSPIPMRAALATLDVIEGDNLPARVHELGQQLRHGLDALADRYSVIGDVRGLGLMRAMEFVRRDKKPAPDLARAFLGRLRDRGLLVGLGGLWNNAVRIAPPMTVTRAEVGTALQAMAEAMEGLYRAEPDLKSVPDTRIQTSA